MRFIVIFLFGLITSLSSFAQQHLLPLNNQFSREEQLLNIPDYVHSSLRPIREQSLIGLKISEGWEEEEPKSSWFMRKLKQESLIQIDTGDLELSIDPLYNFMFTNINNSLGDRVYTNSRGVLVRGSIGAKFSFYSSFYENQSFFPDYADDFVRYYAMVPGNGRVKPFKNTGFDYAMASGYMSYSPFKNLQFLAGHFKQFIGEGYRSLLLSDNAFNYPFLRTTYSFWKHRFEYSYSIAALRQLERIPATNSTEAQLISKWMSYNYLSFKPSKFIELGLFESFIWQRWDSTGTLPVQAGAFIPVMSVNSLAYGLNAGRNNGLIGFNLKLNPLRGLTAYSQYAKGQWGSQDAFQVGVKAYNVMLKDLNLRLEYNSVSGGMYTGRNRFLAYGHYGQSLAHIQGRSFEEIHFQLNYRFKDFFVQFKASNYQLRRDSLPWESQNIFTEFRDPSLDENVMFQDIQFGYLFNPRYNLNLAVGYRRRSGEIDAFGPDEWFYLVLRTSINNLYFDF